MFPSTRAAACGALVIASVLLAGCAMGDAGQAAPTESAPPAPSPTAPAQTADASPAPSPTAPAPTADASPTPSADSASHDDASVFETQNGTMRVEVPAGWSVADTSTVMLNHDRLEQWNNFLTLTAPDGTTLRYSDGYSGDVGAVAESIGVVETRETRSGQLAIATWTQLRSGVEARVILGTLAADGKPLNQVGHEGIGRIHWMALVDADGDRRAVGSVAEAEAFLAGDEAQRALDVIETVELLPVPQYAMP